MTTIRKWVRFVFGFSGTETNGFLILLPLLFIILFSQPVYRAIKSSSDVAISERDKLLLDSLRLALDESKIQKHTSNESRSVVKRQLILFNPNTASDKILMSVGFDEKISKRIVSYRSKGGKFIVKKDLLKVFGIDTLLYNELYAYIDLPETKISKTETTPSNSTFTTGSRDKKFDLNRADTTELKTVYGIGSKRAQRIVAFREKLGGFIHSSQLREVYGLDSASVEQLLKRCFISDGFLPFRLNINTATDRQLSAHPYISPVIAKAIVAYRFQHGNFATVGEIRELQNLKKEEADKIIPYLDVNP
jgi:competence protein ComEA